MARQFFINVVCVGCVLFTLAHLVSAADAPPARSEANLDDSPTAKQAGIKFQRDTDAANHEFEVKLQQLRKDYEAKITTARKAYSTGLKTAQSEETRKGKLEVALVVKQAVAKLDTESVPAWPKQVLPDPALVTDQNAAIGSTPVKELRKFEQVFKFTVEATVRKACSLPNSLYV